MTAQSIALEYIEIIQKKYKTKGKLLIIVPEMDANECTELCNTNQKRPRTNELCRIVTRERKSPS